MITRYEDFRVEAKIPALEPTADPLSPNSYVIREVIDGYIEKYEPQFAALFFNKSEDYDAFLSLSDMPTEQLTDDEKKNLTMLRFSLSHYVAYYYFRSQKNTPIGAVVLESDHGKRSSIEDTIVLIWNQMVDNNEQLYKRLYEEPHGCYNELFRKINTFGL